ncbi:protein SHQ1 homolog [Actinia tenebrosa]|uniref:Protein SHQ1 homolog n=1 Tax=Actinia tenebrosa TaxID=6105 RepID=A0A6P8H0P2_ACTTE|nr:protein SHQ1 homolog [Actinia tenebrosa]
MLTPAFDLSQDENFVIVTIKTPYVKISDVDFFIDGNEFKFYVKPYFLRLNLPGKIVEDGQEGATYDVEKVIFFLKLPKLHQGEHFEGLDMLTSLLSPRKKTKMNQPLIEVINDDSKPSEINDDSSDENSDFDWEIEQVLCEDDVSLDLDCKSEEGKYGFANKKKGIFDKRQEELYEISDVPDPESISFHERRLARLAAEDLNFDPGHYFADFFDEETIQPFLEYSPPWDEEYKEYQEKLKSISADNLLSAEEEQLKNLSKSKFTPADETKVLFTEEEKDNLRHLPNKEYILDEPVQLSLLLGLVDIIFAYAYNHRTTEGENTVESGWTINKISSTLCYFETFTNINDVVTSCYRRCLCYPLHRNWNLVQLVLEDTKKIFALGKRRLLKCLLEIHGLFNEDDPRYILNDLYITDYCVWIQTISKKKLKSLAQNLQKMNLTKKDLGWQLEELEKAGLLVNEENENNDENSEEEQEQGQEDTKECSEVSDEETESSETSSTTSDSEDSQDEHLEIQIGNLKLSSTEEEMDKTGNQDNTAKDSKVNEKIVVLSSETFDP